MAFRTIALVTLGALALGACAKGKTSGPPDVLDEDAGAEGEGEGDGGADGDGGSDCVPGDEECNGEDDDCDGEVDEVCECTDGDTQACWTGDAEARGVGACRDGEQRCGELGWGACQDAVLPEAETCNGVDDDCDGEVDDGDPEGGGACETGLDGPCGEGVYKCVDGALACSAEVEPGREVCNGVDDDCDEDTVDGVEDPDLGGGCDGADADRCVEGVWVCSDGALACTDESGSTPDLCNGDDDDCDPATADGASEPGIGDDCDGADGDLCAEGTLSCNGGELECSDATGTTTDSCNGRDDDCDPLSADGAEDPQVGVLCDGADTDRCNEGAWSCVGGALECGDATGSLTDVCNGLDDDCDGASGDGSEDPLVGTPCDGGDSDRCNEGTWACSGSLTCSDATGGTVDLCNGLDDDCDGASADGSEDPLVGATCDGADTDSCREGTYGCANGLLGCSDATGSTVEACAGNGADEDCDGSVDEGFSQNDDPACGGLFDLGFISGDSGADTATDSFHDEEWDLFTVTEDNDLPLYVSATIELWSPAGVDYDLYVYCNDCGGALAGSSTVGGLNGHWDVVDVRSDDDWGVGDDFDVIVEVRYWDATMCAYWELTVTGNTIVDAETCN